MATVNKIEKRIVNRRILLHTVGGNTVNTISSVLINILSSYFYDKMNIWSQKKEY